MTNYSYSSIDYPGASLRGATGINSLGQIVGDADGNGFLYENGTFTSIIYPGSTEVDLTGINVSGQIVGYDEDGAGNDQGFVYNNGTFTPISFPGATDTMPMGINDAGQVVGQWYQSSIVYGSFLYSDGTYTSVQSPSVEVGSTGNPTFVDTINDAGQISGSYAGGNAPGYYGTTVGFVDINGTYSYFAYPGAYATDAIYINDGGEIAGIYAPTSNSVDESFTYSNGTFSSFAYPDATVTQVKGLNDAGQIVGLYQDSAGGLHGFVATPEVACYVLGTCIQAVRASLEVDVPVETLVLGDLLVTASGEHRPVKWIGRRSYAGRFLASNPGVQPVRFRAGSLGGDLPRRDVLVSPEHAMFLDGLLVPARCLVNGSTIVQERGWDRVDYFHIELDTHDVLLAEGAPSESFMDDDSRGVFHNASEFTAMYPDAPDADRFCAPKVDEGYELEAIRRWLAAVAGEMAQAA